MNFKEAATDIEYLEQELVRFVLVWAKLM